MSGLDSNPRICSRDVDICLDAGLVSPAAILARRIIIHRVTFCSRLSRGTFRISPSVRSLARSWMSKFGRGQINDGSYSKVEERDGGTEARREGAAWLTDEAAAAEVRTKTRRASKNVNSRRSHAARRRRRQRFGRSGLSALLPNRVRVATWHEYIRMH